MWCLCRGGGGGGQRYVFLNWEWMVVGCEGLGALKINISCFTCG